MKDYAALIHLWRVSGLEIRPGDGRKELQRKLERDPELFIVARVGTRLVGSVVGAWDGRRGWVYHLAVDPRYRRRRLATRMIRELEKRMKKKGVLKVNAMVYLWNGPSLALFEGLGYLRQSDMVVMGKLLPSVQGGGKVAAKATSRRKARLPLSPTSR